MPTELIYAVILAIALFAGMCIVASVALSVMCYCIVKAFAPSVPELRFGMVRQPRALAVAVAWG